MSVIPFPSKEVPVKPLKPLEEMTLLDLVNGTVSVPQMAQIIDLLTNKKELPPNLTEAFCTLGVHFLNMECVSTISTVDPRLSFTRFVENSWIFSNVAPYTYGLVLAGIHHEMYCIPKMEKEREQEAQHEDFLSTLPLNDGGEPA